MLWLSSMLMASIGIIYVTWGIIETQIIQTITLPPYVFTYQAVFPFPQEPEQENLNSDVRRRLLGYLLVTLGLSRVFTSLFWSCGYVSLGIMLSFVEIGFLSLEISKQQQVSISNALKVMGVNIVVVIAYICVFLPSCQ
jgi:hypothetical protein